MQPTIIICQPAPRAAARLAWLVPVPAAGRERATRMFLAAYTAALSALLVAASRILSPHLGTAADLAAGGIALGWLAWLVLFLWVDRHTLRVPDPVLADAVREANTAWTQLPPAARELSLMLLAATNHAGRLAAANPGNDHLIEAAHAQATRLRRHAARTGRPALPAPTSPR